MIDSEFVHNVFDEETGLPLPQEERDRRVAGWLKANGQEVPAELGKPLWEAHNELVSKLQKFTEEVDLKIAQLERRVQTLERLNKHGIQQAEIAQTFQGEWDQADEAMVAWRKMTPEERKITEAAIVQKILKGAMLMQRDPRQNYAQLAATTCAIPMVYSTSSSQPVYGLGNPW